MKTTNLVTISDYRNTSFKNYDFSLGEKKNEFMVGFRLNHPRAWNIHSYVSARDGLYNQGFREMYHNKCVYCGISTQVVNASTFEVDHVIPKFVLDLDWGYDKHEIHGIQNLVNSCQMCNRGKQSFLCDNKSLQKLHPDRNILPQILSRNNDYSIEINDEYKNNQTIKDFYTKLKLDNQLRRLDYLLMEMKDFCDSRKGILVIEIQNLILKIENKRRRNY